MADTKSPARKIPEGYEDEAAFLKEARERFQEAVDADRENRDAALEDLEFLAGKQWDDSALTSRKGRPCLTINRLPQFVAQVVGDIRINRPAIRVRPAEDADKELAEIREGLIRAIERSSDAQGVYASAGQSQVGCGIGNYRISLKYASEDGFDRDIAIERIPNPFAVVWDPLLIEPTGRDARYCFVQDDWPRKAFEAQYPDDKPSDLDVPLLQTRGWMTTDTVKVTEYWVIKTQPLKLALLEGGAVVPEDKLPKGVKPVQTRTARRKTACMYLITGHAILEGPFELPIDRVPIIRVPGWEINVGEKKVRFGLVRFAKDPQRLMNYWRSVSAEMLALAPKEKWLAHSSQVPDDREDDFRNAAKSDDPLLIYEGQPGNPPTRTSPPQMPAAVLQEAALNSQDMKDVTGLHDASLGARSNETSGKAILARQKEGDVATYVYHDNLQAGIAEGGRVVNQLIPITFDTARTIRVVGEDETTKVQRINDPNHPESIDINQGKYDIVVEAGPSYSTKRVEAAESMMQFIQSVPAAAQFAGDLIAKAMDWPMADVLAERLKKTIPPQVLQGEDGAQPPPPPDPAAQQAQQMQMQAATLELQEKEAAVKQAQANAAKAEFEAQKAELELTAMQVHGINGDHTFGKAAEREAQNAAKFGQGSPTPGQPATGATAA